MNKQTYVFTVCNVINFDPIDKLLLLFLLVSLLSCGPDDRLTGVAAGASGRYIVTTYIVAGDTLFSLRSGSTGYKTEINRIGVDNFAIAMDAIESDQLILKTSYWRNGLQSTFSKKVVVRLTNYDYQLSLVTPNTTSNYEGSVGRFTRFFYERTVGGGVLIPPTDSLTVSNPSSSREVIIVAQPAR